MRHGVPELETNDDLNFSAMAMALSDKQISRQKNDYSLSNCLGGNQDSALYVLFGSYRKTERITASRSVLFSNAAGAPVCFHAEPTVANVTEYISLSGADIFVMNCEIRSIN